MTTYNLPNGNVLSVYDDGTQEFYIDQSTFLAILQEWEPRIDNFVWRTRDVWWPWQDKFNVILRRWVWHLERDYYELNLTLKKIGADKKLIVYIDNIGMEVTINKYRKITIKLSASTSMRGRYFDNIIRDVVGLPASRETIDAGLI
jgi:hypothetical protein